VIYELHVGALVPTNDAGTLTDAMRARLSRRVGRQRGRADALSSQAFSQLRRHSSFAIESSAGGRDKYKFSSAYQRGIA
jgi:hypothetical protein